MNPRACFVVRSVAPLAAVLLLSPGCGSNHGDLFSGSSGTATGAGGSGGTGASTGGTAAGGASSATGMPTGSSATGTGGATSTGTGGSGGGCPQVSWYCDGDKDGYGDPKVSEKACDAPPGGDAKCPGPYVASENDCGPGDAAAHPDQMSYFGTPVLPPAPSPAFDYNCDGQEEKDPDQLYNGGTNLNCGFMDCFSPIPRRGFGPNAQCGGKTEYYQCSSTGFGCMLWMASAPEPLRCR